MITRIFALLILAVVTAFGQTASSKDFPLLDKILEDLKKNATKTSRLVYGPIRSVAPLSEKSGCLLEIEILDYFKGPDEDKYERKLQAEITGPENEYCKENLRTGDYHLFILSKDEGTYRVIDYYSSEYIFHYWLHTVDLQNL